MELLVEGYFSKHKVVHVALSVGGVWLSRKAAMNEKAVSDAEGIVEWHCRRDAGSALYNYALVAYKSSLPGTISTMVTLAWRARRHIGTPGYI